MLHGIGSNIKLNSRNVSAGDCRLKLGEGAQPHGPHSRLVNTSCKSMKWKAELATPFIRQSQLLVNRLYFVLFSRPCRNMSTDFV